MKRKIKRAEKFWVYMVECADGTYYTGYTKDLQKRLKEHNSGKRGAKYTRPKRPVKVAWKKEYQYKYYAMSAEYKIKQLTRPQKKMLVGGIRLDKVLAKVKREDEKKYKRK